MTNASAPHGPHTISREALEHVNNLATWLQEISEQENWRPYRGSNEVKQCSHPDRAIKLRSLISAGKVETKGRAAFFIRCRGPCTENLEPTSLETFPGELLTLNHGNGFSPTADGKPLVLGEWTALNQPVKIHVASADILFLLVIFTKR